MFARNEPVFLSFRATVEHGVKDPAALARALSQFIAGHDLGALRMSYLKVVRDYSLKRLLLAVTDPASQDLALWDRTNVDGGWSTQMYIRDNPSPDVAEYTDRAVAMVLPDRPGGFDCALSFALLLTEHFGVVSISIARHQEYRYAAKECIRQGVAGAPWNASIETRINWDAMKWRRARTKLVRLYPVTIIGPAIWAQLPPMPAFDPMPTVEDLGNCKLLTAWPTLCDPRDPDFLRGTRALREWLWPYTIQNPADHVDNDPPD